MAIRQTAGRDALGTFAPKFAPLSDGVLFGEVWSREEQLSLRDCSPVTAAALGTQGLVDESFRYHLAAARKNGITREEIAEIVTPRGGLLRLAEGVGGVPHGEGNLERRRGDEIMLLNECYALPNGALIPKIGLGTWCIPDDQAAQAVESAVKLGYRLIDTAQAYGNERGAGEGVRACGVPRGELFVASKVAAELKSYEEAVD